MPSSEVAQYRWTVSTMLATTAATLTTMATMPSFDPARIARADIMIGTIPMNQMWAKTASTR